MYYAPVFLLTIPIFPFTTVFYFSSNNASIFYCLYPNFLVTTASTFCYLCSHFSINRVVIFYHQCRHFYHQCSYFPINTVLNFSICVYFSITSILISLPMFLLFYFQLNTYLTFGSGVLGLNLSSMTDCTISRCSLSALSTNTPTTFFPFSPSAKKGFIFPESVMLLVSGTLGIPMLADCTCWYLANLDKCLAPFSSKSTICWTSGGLALHVIAGSVCTSITDATECFVNKFGPWVSFFFFFTDIWTVSLPK